MAPAPLERIPLFVPAGAIIPTTDTVDPRQRHDEPSRALRIFPGAGRGSSTFTLYEDDGHSHRHRDGDHAQVVIDMEWDAQRIRVRARKSGDFALPYTDLGVVLSAAEQRRLVLAGDNAVTLTRR
jgi:alpha-glucosidase